MRLNVHTPTGASYVVEADGDDTVASVKTKLQGVTGVHPAQQRLMQSGGRQLTLDQDTHTLAQYHLQMEEDLVLIERPAPQVIELNVGGARYAALRSTLLSCAGSKLFEMFEGLAQGGEATECPPEGIPGEESAGVRAPLPRGADGAYFIDRDGASFRYILQYLRACEPELADDAAKPEQKDGDEMAAWLAQPLAPELLEGRSAIEGEIERLTTLAAELAAAGDFTRLGPISAAGEALKQRVGAPQSFSSRSADLKSRIAECDAAENTDASEALGRELAELEAAQSAVLLAAVLRDRKLVPALEAAGREEEAASVAQRAATMAAECVALGGQVPEEDTALASDDDLDLAAKLYLPATSTELQMLAAEAEYFALSELVSQCHCRLRQLQSERAREMILHSILTCHRIDVDDLDDGLACFRPEELVAARLQILQLNPALAGLGHAILGKLAAAGCSTLEAAVELVAESFDDDSSDDDSSDDDEEEGGGEGEGEGEEDAADCSKLSLSSRELAVVKPVLKAQLKALKKKKDVRCLMVRLVLSVCKRPCMRHRCASRVCGEKVTTQPPITESPSRTASPDAARSRRCR
jgi:hypothetical protein